MVKFCPDCDKVMVDDVSTGNLMFICPACAKEVKAGIDERVVHSKNLRSELNPFKRFINGAPKDPAGNKIDKSCPKCKKPWLTRVRVGREERPVLTCECGFIEGIVS